MGGKCVIPLRVPWKPEERQHRVSAVPGAVQRRAEIRHRAFTLSRILIANPVHLTHCYDIPFRKFYKFCFID